MRIAALIALCLLGGCTLMARPTAPVAFHPAYWVEGTGIAPNDGDYELNALSFASPREGWVVGNRFALHIQDDRLEVAFLRPRELSLWDVELASATSGLAGGSLHQGWGEPSKGAVLRYDGRRWQPEEVSPTLFPQWWIQRVSAVPGGDDRAIGAVFSGPATQIVPSQVEMYLLRRSAGQWAIDDTAPATWRANDLCTTAAADTWMVGAVRGDARRFSALAAHARDGAWTVAPLPPLGGDAQTLSRVVCPAAGGVVALGGVWRESDRVTELVLLRFTDHWEHIALPADLIHGDAIIAARSVDDVWVAVSCPASTTCPTRFLHWTGGQWTVVPAPALPGGRASGYIVTDMQFVSPDEGWAVANDYGGSGITRGLLFHYRDGAWRVRNWDWHFWNQPGLGWFGD